MKFPSLISEVDLIFVGAAANLDNAHHLDHDDTEENICRRIISLLHQQASTDSLYRLNACFIQDIDERIVDNRVTGLVSLGTAVDESNCSVCYAKSTKLLSLNVNKQTYQRMGIAGKQSYRYPDRYLISFDSSKRISDREREMLGRLSARFDFLLLLATSAEKEILVKTNLNLIKIPVEQMIGNCKFYSSLPIPSAAIRDTGDSQPDEEPIREWMELVQLDSKLALTGQTSRLDPYISNYELPLPNETGWALSVRLCGLFTANQVLQLKQELHTTHLRFVSCKSFIKDCISVGFIDGKERPIDDNV